MIRSKLREIRQAAKQPGGIKGKLKYYEFAKLARENGVVDFRVDRVAKGYVQDYFENQCEDDETKKWCYSKGLASYKLKFYDMTKENYKNYISDFDFYNKNNYKNREFESWFENKLNTYYLLMPFKEFMPRHYWYAGAGELLPLDVETKKNGSAGDVIRMLKGNKILAAKAAVGGHGVGFYKLEYNNGKYYANNKQISETGMEELINNLDKYIITDFIKPHRQYAQLYGEDAFAVIRVLTIYDSKDGAQFTAASIRFGGKDAGIVTDYHGTIYCGLKLENGETFKPFYREDDDVFIKCEKHPDTGNSLIGNKVPKWEELITLVKRISASIPMTPYLVMDVIPTDDGFSVLEINNHGQVRILEPYYPFLENEYNRKVFEIKDR